MSPRRHGALSLQIARFVGQNARILTEGQKPDESCALNTVPLHSERNFL
jgi:hypothetical protein